MSFLNHLISGISLGSIYAIIALGYTMVYGIAKMLNFAHGDVIMVGGYMCFCATTYLGWPAWMGVVLAVIVCTVLGVVIERLAYKPLRMAPSLAVLITAIGVSYFLQNAALLIWSSNPKTFTSCSAYPTLMPTTGSLPGIKAFTAAVFGGIGSIPGAFIGGILLGIIEIFAKAYISTQLSDAIVFAVLIVVLLVKPDGLLGKHVSEKV